MPILIDRVRIYNFRSLKKCTVDLSPVTLIIGANNSGKTSFLKALNIALGIGAKRISHEDFYIGVQNAETKDKEIIIDIRIIPVGADNKRIDTFNDIWREKQFGELINLDSEDKEYFSFRTKVSYDLLKGDYVIKRYKIKEWQDDSNWETAEYKEELKQYFDGFPLFFMDAQRDIISDLRDRTSYFGRMLSKIKIDDALIKEIEEKIKTINEGIVSNSPELKFLKEELQKIKATLSTGTTIEINPVNKKLRDINRGININLQDASSESFPLDYHGMGTRSWASFLTFGAFISWQYQNTERENEPFHTILALEEPEAHLHPHAQRTLYKQLSELKGQKIISTHSPFIASQANLDEIRHFKKKDSETEVKVINLSGMTDEDKRKLRREVLHTRGELLFADTVVLFEGETEEQALPIFAEKYWGKHPYEMGISYIGVGGDSGYTPFLRLLNSFEIKWFIFSDGEQQSIEKVKKALKEFGITSIDTQNNVTIIPDNKNIEQYLVGEGYQSEIKKAILQYKKDNGEIKNDHHLKAKQEEINGMNNTDLISFLSSWKTKMSPYYAAEICKLTDGRAIPKVIAKLFDSIKNSME